MKYFTGKGDSGSTGLIGSERVSKADPRLEAIGSLDELSEFVGQAKALCGSKVISQVLESVQKDLYSIMAELADVHKALNADTRLDYPRLVFLEQTINELGEKIEMPKGFILPGKTKEAAALGICRVVARRAERRVVEVNRETLIENQLLLAYLNRLSSLFYLLEISSSSKKELYQNNRMEA